MSIQPVISSAEAHDLLGQAVFIDTRHLLSDPSWGKKNYDAGHIEGALFMDLDHDLSTKPTGKNGRHPLPDRAAFQEKLLQAGVLPDRRVIIYDQDSGAFAARLWWMLSKWLDYKNVSVLDGGAKAWAEAGYALTTTVAPLEAALEQRKALREPSPSLDANIVTQQQVRDNLQSSAFQVVDARGPERFRGDVEPMDPVAGHIPDAINRPFSENVDANGRFKSVADLRREWEALLGDRPPEEIVHQCGSGVTACHNLLAMEQAGLKGSRLYAGSWSEWCTNPENPMVIGTASK